MATSAGTDQNTSSDNKGQPPVYQSQDSNPYHVGYDQNQGNSNPNHAGYNQNQGNSNPNHAGYDQNQGHAMVPIQMQPQGNNISIQTQPIYVVNTVDQHQDLTCYSVLACFFCCCCTGIAAIVFAEIANNEHRSGKIEAAKHSNKIARTLIYVSIGIHVLFWIVGIGLFLGMYVFAMHETANMLDSFDSGSTTSTTARPWK